MLKADIIRIQHMIDSAREALSFAKGKARADLDDDRKLTLSII